MTERKGRWRGGDKVREREEGGENFFFHLFFSFFFFLGAVWTKLTVSHCTQIAQ